VEQSGWPAAVLCVIGFALLLRQGQRLQNSAFIALMVATYVTFSPLAELRARHAIYWMPSVAFFAVCGLEAILGFVRRTFSGERQGVSPPSATGISRKADALPLAVGVYAILFASTAFGAMSLPTYRVEGYSSAAAQVLDKTSPGDSVFFDGWWDGNFTYHMRHLDPSRSRSVIRGDKLLYDFVCVPSTDFQKHVENDREIVSKFIEANPKFVVLENPQFFQTIEVAQELRDLVKNHPDIFEPVNQIPVKSSIAHLPEFHIDVLRFNAQAASHWLQQTK